MKGAFRLTVAYGLFAFISTAANISNQFMAFRVCQGPYAKPLSTLVGTHGLPMNYGLEKRHIFGFESKILARDEGPLVLYTALCIFTAALFGGIGDAFHQIFGTDAICDRGGLLGLRFSHLNTYRLDRCFVFVTRPAKTSGVL